MYPNNSRRKILILVGLAVIFAIAVAAALSLVNRSSNTTNSSMGESGSAETSQVQLNSEDGRILSAVYPKDLKVDAEQAYLEGPDNYGGLIIFDSTDGGDYSDVDYYIVIKLTYLETASSSEDLLYELVGNEPLQEPEFEDIKIDGFTGQLVSSEYMNSENSEEYYASTALLNTSSENGGYIEFSAIYKKTSDVTHKIIKSILASVEVG